MSTATATETIPMAERISYEDLYQRWEKGNWSATALDFTADRDDWWNTFSEHERKAALWNYALFFHGEDSVADNLSPYIDAAPREEQKYFLATQQVDEARHAVFFGRFMREVVEQGSDIGSSLDATHRQLTPGFRKTFALLDEVADRLRKDRSRPQLAAAITMYHLVVEATLAQPGQHFIDTYLKDRGVLPGFSEGMGNVSLDEQRHIGFGVRLLYDLQREDPDCRYAVADLLREVMPVSIDLFVPPNWDETYVTCFGSTLKDVYIEGMVSLESKMKAAGLPLESLPGAPPFPFDLTPEERAERAIILMRAGFLGTKNGEVSRDPEKIGLLFDMIARTVDKEAAPPNGLTIQWDFPDAAPYHLRVDNGTTSAAEGLVEDADLTLRVPFEDWVDVTAGRTDPRRLMLRGRLRPRGSVRTMLRLPKLFGRV